jgi:molecular chaperone DnaK (HSP70)
LERHENDSVSGGIQSLLPSIIGVIILACGILAKLGFRGRASVAGIDLGTTNSVICVQAPSKGVGHIDCIRDPRTNSSIVPSVVSFLEASERKVGPSSKIKSLLDPHPSHVVVGQAGKQRINSHPHHTLYQAKRVLGRPYEDDAVAELQREVEFVVTQGATANQVAFAVPDTHRLISPQQVGAYVIHHLLEITHQFLGHSNIKSAVICVPAKFNTDQRRATLQAFQLAGVSVTRVVEEPTAAALAYGLHRKAGVDYILVYDFGGGTLDVSLLYVTDGFVDVLGSDGDTRLGGSDFDAAVAHFLLEQQGGADVVQQVAKALHSLEKLLKHGEDLEEKLAAVCAKLQDVPLCTSSSFHTLGEQLKIGLSAYPDHDGQVEAQCYALPSTTTTTSDDMTTYSTIESFCNRLRPITLTLTSQEYDHSVQSLYDRSLLPVHRILTDLSLTASDIDEVVLVGGTTRMPQIRTLVGQALPSSELNSHIDPDLTVAYGAASVID